MYLLTLWRDHAVVPADTYRVTKNEDGIYTVVPAGEVIQQGTNMSADNFNNMEFGITDAHIAVGFLLNLVRQGQWYSQELAEKIAGLSTQLEQEVEKLSGNESGMDEDIRDIRFAYETLLNYVRQNKWEAEQLAENVSTLASAGIGTERYSVSVPTVGWEKDSGPFALRLDIENSRISVNHTPVLAIAPWSVQTAINCGLCGTVETLDGILRLYAQSVPEAEMNAILTLVGTTPDLTDKNRDTGASGGVSATVSAIQSLPVASRTRLGVVRIGEGVNVTPGGEISVDAASYVQSPTVTAAVSNAAASAAETAVIGAVAQNTASDDEADEMLGEIFGN